MPLICLSDLNDARLAPFSRMTDAELRDPRQLVGLARALSAQAKERGEDATLTASAHAPQNAGEAAIVAAGSPPASTCAPQHGFNARTSNPSMPTPASSPSALANASNPNTRASASHDANWLANGLFIGESKNVIERALAAGIIPFALLIEQHWLSAARPLTERLLEDNPRLPIFTATRAQVRELTGLECTRGPLAAFLRPPLPRPEDLLARARRVSVLEDITNYTNIGAIFRSAAALGIDAVFVTPSCHDPFYRRAARVSMGAVFQVPWTRIGMGEARNGGNGEGENRGEGESWTRTGIPLLRAAGFTTCALALSDDSIAVHDARLRSCEKLALVLGTEGDGLAPHTIAQCDYTVRIPMDNGVDSLNVAAASAVAFWELRVNHRD